MYTQYHTFYSNMPDIEYFDTKSIEWTDTQGNVKKSNILLQNKNGPCPLVALVNNLILSDHKIGAFTQGKPAISVQGILDQLGEILADNLHASNEYDFETVFALLPHLITGLNINPRFDGTFDDGPEMAIFRLYDTDIVHGWICDPQSPYYETLMSVGSYDQTQSLLIRVAQETTSVTEQDHERAAAVHSFTEEYGSQLTPTGITFLKELINPGQPCVFFRNNHFATLYKRANELYILVTDSGLKDEPRIIWQKLSDVSGREDTFYNGAFEVQYDLGQVSGAAEGEVRSDDADYKLARELQMQEDSQLASSLTATNRRRDDRRTKQKKKDSKCVLM